MLIRNGGLPIEMDVNSAQGLNLSMLVLNLLSCMCNNQPMSDVNPLAELINQPLEAVHHFLPTMADNQVEVYAATVKATLTGTNVTIYRECVGSAEVYSTFVFEPDHWSPQTVIFYIELESIRLSSCSSPKKMQICCLYNTCIGMRKCKI